MPSFQLAAYLQLRADGETVERASELSGIGLAEARLHEADIEAGELELPRARAPAPARAREGQPEGASMDGVKTSIRVGDGPEVPIDLKKDIDDPANADAKEAISGVVANAIGKSGTVAADELRLLIERVERIKEEIAGLNDDVRDIYAEAKSRGFDTAAVKRIIKLRKLEPHALQEAEAVLALYMDALGMSPDHATVALAA